MILTVTLIGDLTFAPLPHGLRRIEDGIKWGHVYSCKSKCSGGTTNLRNHLRVNHPSLYDKLVSSSKDSQCESSCCKQDMMDRFLHSFTSGEKLSSRSQRMKMLSDAIAEFIVRDMRPVSVVDGLGFLNLMHIVEPRYITLCRKMVMELIEWKYTDLKRDIHGHAAQQEWVSLTTNMWTLRTGDDYISLTAHFFYCNFEMMHRNLETRHLPGVHDHSHLAIALCASTSEWCINLACMSAFTNENATNIVKTVKEDLEISASHTINLAVQSALMVTAISSALSHCKKFPVTSRSRRVTLKPAAAGTACTFNNTG